jgi:hypothetical protein
MIRTTRRTTMMGAATLAAGLARPAIAQDGTVKIGVI